MATCTYLNPRLREGSPWTECSGLMEKIFGAPMPSMYDMISSNPIAVAEHFLWNILQSYPLDCRLLRAQPEPTMAVDISVIIPLVFVRGPTRRAIESWTRQQRMDRQRYEVIAVSPGDNPKTEQLIRDCLGPADRLVNADTHNLYALYDIGIQHSQGRIVMITESHVVAMPDCLKDMVETLDQTDNEAACCNAIPPKDEGYLATMEAMLFEEESAQWIPEGSWRRVHERGFAIYRDTYDRTGGFQHEYGWFAGRAFASRLHATGVPVAYAPDVRVVHFNSVTTRDIVEGARSFVFGELRYRETEPEARVTHYFGRSNALAARELYCGRLARTALRDRLDRLKRRRWPQRVGALPGLAYAVLRSMFGIGLPITVAQVQAHATRVRVAALRPFGPAAGLDAYREYWHRRLVRRFQLEYCRDEAPVADGSGPTTVRAEDTQHQLTGFYPIEELGGHRICWTNSFAAVRIRVSHRSKRIHLETVPTDSPLDERAPALYLNQTKLNVKLEQPHIASAEIESVARDKQTATLVITCDPIHLTDDPRELGLPFKWVKVTEN